MKKSVVSSIIISFLIFHSTIAQIAINETGENPETTAMLDVKSSDKGILIPRMTQSERDAINEPATGLMIYQTDFPKGFYFFDGFNWKLVGDDSDAIAAINNRQRKMVSNLNTFQITQFNQDLNAGVSLNITGHLRDVLLITRLNINNTVATTPAGTTVIIKLRIDSVPKIIETIVIPADSRQLATIQWLEKDLALGSHTFDIIISSTTRIDLESRNLFAIEL